EKNEANPTIGGALHQRRFPPASRKSPQSTRNVTRQTLGRDAAPPILTINSATPTRRPFDARDARPMTDALFDIRGKIALVTGGTSGIGLMIARGLVKRGVKTYIAGRDAAAAAEVAARIAADGE